MCAASTGRALVLGGGGVTGIAWELGLLAGLAEKGVDMMSPDVVVGTSAGSVVGAQITSGVPIEDLYAEQLLDPSGEIAASIGAGALAQFVIASIWPGDPRRGRAYLGRAALAARTVPEAERRRVIETRLRSRSWPERRLLITAVDAKTGHGFTSSNPIVMFDSKSLSTIKTIKVEGNPDGIIVQFDQRL